MDNWAIFKKVFLLFFGWRVALLILVFYVSGIIPIQNRGNESFYTPSVDNYWAHWEQWDAAHILGIVDTGYTLQRTPFFPVYPILIKSGEILGISSFWAGFIIANIATLVALFFFYKLVLLDYSEYVAEKAIILLLIFPTSFFLGAVYSEALFLAFSISAFYFARKNNWLLAAILAGLAAGTRLIGVAVIFAIFAEYFFTKVPQFKFEFLYNTSLKRITILIILFKLFFELMLKSGFFGEGLIGGIVASVLVIFDYLVWFMVALLILFYSLRYFDIKKLFYKTTLYLPLAFIPIGLFMVFMYFQFGEPLGFFKGHENWGRHFTVPSSTVINHLRLMSPNIFTTGIRNQLQLELLAFILLAVFFVWSLLKMRFSYVVYFGLSILFPLTSGKLMSMPRIALVIFPMFILMAQVRNEYLKKAWIFISILLLAVLTIMHTHNYWVA